MSCGDESNDKREGSESGGGAERREVGCCGDVPESVSSKAALGGGGGKRKERLLEWLKNSQTKREENNRQVLARWIDMVDHGVIDLASLSPCKAAPSPLSQPCSPSTPSINTSSPTTNNIPQQYFSPISPNYYTVAQNWFASNPPTAIYPPQSFNVYSGGSYCPSSHLMSNYYPYTPFHQQCTLCPSYIVPNTTINIENNGNTAHEGGGLNFNTEKWFDVLSDIKIKGGRGKKSEEGGERGAENRNQKEES